MDTKDYLLDDYIIMYVNTKNEKYLRNAILKLIRCGFDYENTLKIISTEVDIIKFRRRLPNSIIEEKFWMNKMDVFSKYKNFRLFNQNKDYYLVKDSKISEYTLTLSELCAIYHEAYNICNLESDHVPLNVFYECLSICKHENSSSWIIKEFKDRIESLYVLGNGESSWQAERKITNLYKAELTLLENREC